LKVNEDSSITRDKHEFVALSQQPCRPTQGGDVNTFRLLQLNGNDLIVLLAAIKQRALANC
jgi:hypothetical protein